MNKNTTKEVGWHWTRPEPAETKTEKASKVSEGFSEALERLHKFTEEQHSALPDEPEGSHSREESGRP